MARTHVGTKADRWRNAGHKLASCDHHNWCIWSSPESSCPRVAVLTVDWASCTTEIHLARDVPAGQYDGVTFFSAHSLSQVILVCVKLRKANQHSHLTSNLQRCLLHSLVNLRTTTAGLTNCSLKHLKIVFGSWFSCLFWLWFLRTSLDMLCTNWHWWLTLGL